MRKTFCSLAAVMMCWALFSSCGTKDARNSIAKESDPSASEEMTLSVDCSAKLLTFTSASVKGEFKLSDPKKTQDELGTSTRFKTVAGKYVVTRHDQSLNVSSKDATFNMYSSGEQVLRDEALLSTVDGSADFKVMGLVVQVAPASRSDLNTTKNSNLVISEATLIGGDQSKEIALNCKTSLK